MTHSQIHTFYIATPKLNLLEQDLRGIESYLPTFFTMYNFKMRKKQLTFDSLKDHLLDKSASYRLRYDSIEDAKDYILKEGADMAMMNREHYDEEEGSYGKNDYVFPVYECKVEFVSPTANFPSNAVILTADEIKITLVNLYNYKAELTDTFEACQRQPSNFSL